MISMILVTLGYLSEATRYFPTDRFHHTVMLFPQLVRGRGVNHLVYRSILTRPEPYLEFKQPVSSIHVHVVAEQIMLGLFFE